MTQTRLVQVRQNILKHNDILARRLRERFQKANVFVISLVSSPGSGKTAFLEKTLTSLKGKIPSRRARRRFGNGERCNAFSACRSSGETNYHRNDLSSRSRDGRKISGRLGFKRTRFSVHRKRRQSRLPVELRSWRSLARRADVHDRRRRQTAQISDDL